VSAESHSIPQGPSKTSEIVQKPSAESSFKQLKQLVRYFPLPWSHYVRLMLRPYPADEMKMWPVSERVNSPKNDDPSLLDPIR
jgi:hypothetical protein